MVTSLVKDHELYIVCKKRYLQYTKASYNKKLTMVCDIGTLLQIPVTYLRTLPIPKAVICSTSESSGTLWISGVEYSLKES